MYSGEETEFLACGLQPGTAYRVRVAAESSGGRSDYSETCFVTTEPVVPGPPGQPRTTAPPRADRLHLAWTAPSADGGASVTEFEVDMTGPDNLTRGVYRGRDTECVVASLLPGRPYLLQVRAHNRAGHGPWSSPLEVVSGAGAPDMPKEPRATAKSGTAASVAWDEPINNGAVITGYRLEIAQVAGTVDLVESEDEEEEEELDKEDKDEVEEELDDAESNYDDESDVEEAEETNCDKLMKDEVEEARLASQEQEEPAPAAAPAPAELVWQLAYGGADTTCELRDLVPATQYQLRLAALNSAGSSQYSAVVELVTPASSPAPPSGLCLTSATSSSLALQWARPASHGQPLLGYTLHWTGPGVEQGSVAVLRRRAVVRELRPDTQYTVRVAGENSVGRGGSSGPLRVSTRPLPPAPPRLECLTANHNQLKLRWGDSKVQLGTNYVLEMENQRRVWYTVYQGNNHSYKAGKLAENTEYRFRISAVTEAGQGPASPVSSFRTAFAPPPSVKGAPRISNVTESGCLVHWTGLKGLSEMGYRVQLTRVKDSQVSNQFY